MNIFLLDIASNAIFIAKYILYEVLQLMVILYLCGTCKPSWPYVIDFLINQGFNYCDEIAFIIEKKDIQCFHIYWYNHAMVKQWGKL